MFIPLPVATGSAGGAMFALLVSLIYGSPFDFDEIKGIQAWYEPFAGYAKLKFDLGTSEFADIGSSYAEFWTHHSSKERATDALVLIYERVLEQQKKL